MKLPQGLRQLESRLARAEKGIKDPGDAAYWERLRRSFLCQVFRPNETTQIQKEEE